MKTLVLFICVLCAFGLPAQSNSFHAERYSKIAIPDPDQQTLSQIQNAGIDLACGSRIVWDEGIRTLELECSQRELNMLIDEKIDHVILINDVEEFYAQRAQANLSQARSSLASQKVTEAHIKSNIALTRAPEYPVPERFVLGELGGFLYYDQILATLDSMAVQYPHLITRKTPVSETIETRQGHPVFWVRISDHADQDENEPEVLYTGLTHAREPAGTMSLIYFMWYLLENYERDSGVRRIIDHTELFFIPVVNPDGVLYNESLAPQGGGMWRKNLHDNDGNAHIDGNDGVDLNRNYGYLWGHDDLGSSPHPASSTYRGESAFSEPETRMIRDFVLQRQFVTAMHDHAYGNDLYHAWDHGPETLPDAEAFYQLSDEMTWHNRYLFGESYATYWLGTINGGVNDWFYGEQSTKPRIFSWLPEIGGAFWPDPLDIVQICRDQMEPHMMIAKIAGQHVKIHNLNTRQLSYGVNTLKFRLENMGLIPGNFNVSVIPVNDAITSYTVEHDGVVAFRQMLESAEISINIEIDRQIEDGSLIEFELIVDGADYQVASMRVSSVVNPVIMLQNDMSREQMDMWVTDYWGLGTDPLNQADTCITDSPEGNQLNDFNTIQLREGLNLKEVSWATISFEAKWNIETTHDFVQVQARVAGGEWTPLTGRYTKAGALGNLIEIPSPHAGQPLGEPIYDGRQLDWICEEIDLSDFVGYSDVELRFVAWSGGTVSAVEEDGFYFKDFQVLTSRNTHCSDHLQNADEEGIDCGGVHCALCPTCDDGMLNGIEEGIDCGGFECEPCPSCSDGIQNQDEAAIDCGGINCSPCRSCEDGVQNGFETGVDCGGDCDSCVPTCDDGLLNGNEVDVDCGGDCPDDCKVHCCKPHINQIWYGTRGLSLNISPNPVKEQLVVDVRADKYTAMDVVQWDIIDMTGTYIDQGAMFLNTETKIDVSHLQPQMYLVRITDAQGGVVQRFLKQE